MTAQIASYAGIPSVSRTLEPAVLSLTEVPEGLPVRNRQVGRRGAKKMTTRAVAAAVDAAEATHA